MKKWSSVSLLVILLLSITSHAFAEPLPAPILNFKNPGSFITNEENLPFLTKDKKGNQTLVVSIDYSKDNTFKEQLTGIDIKTGKIQWSKPQIGIHILTDSDRRMIYMYSRASNRTNKIVAVTTDGVERWSKQMPQKYDEVYLSSATGDLLLTTYDSRNDRSSISPLTMDGKTPPPQTFNGKLEGVAGKYWLIYNSKHSRYEVLNTLTNQRILNSQLSSLYLLSGGKILLASADYGTNTLQIAGYDPTGKKLWNRTISGKLDYSNDPIRIIGNTYLVTTTNKLELYDHNNKLIAKHISKDMVNIMADEQTIAFETIINNTTRKLTLLDPKTLKTRQSLDLINNRLSDYGSAYYHYLGDHYFYQENHETDSIEVHYLR